MTLRLDSPLSRPLTPSRPTETSVPRAEVANAVAPPAVADTFQQAAAADSQAGVLPLSQRIFAKPMIKFGAESTVSAKVTVGVNVDLSGLVLDLDLQHPDRGDLVVKLSSPSGKSVTVSNREGGGVPNLTGPFDLSQAFAGEDSRGEWTITVENAGSHAEGMLDNWAVAVSGKTQARPVPNGQPVAISDLASRFGWKLGEWQTRLLAAADAKTGAPDGKVSVAELDGYLADPDDLAFLTSSAMQVQRDAVKAAGGVKAVSSFEDGWQRALAARADGDGDGQLGGVELNAYLTTVKAGSASAQTLWMPDQKAAPFASRIADHTGEGDLLSTGGLPDQSLLLTKDYMRISSGSPNRVPNWVSYQLSAADVAERPAGVVRPSDFKTDPELGNLGSFDRDYTGSGFDRGHQKPARDSVNQESMDESMLLSNIAPQTPELNQAAWEMLEQATWELTQATRGKSTIFTGGLFLDPQGKPLPEDQKQWIGKDGKKFVAVPTHFFKAVLVRLPDGTQKAYAYLLPNRKDLPRAETANDQVLLLQQNRVSVDRLEALVGEDLFAALGDSDEARLEAETAPSFDGFDRERFQVASLIWPAPGTTGSEKSLPPIRRED